RGNGGRKGVEFGARTYQAIEWQKDCSSIHTRGPNNVRRLITPPGWHAIFSTMYTHHTYDFWQESQSFWAKTVNVAAPSPCPKQRPPLRERHRDRNETSGHLPLC
ncbi:unnamed protein product, partial [Ectocarpus sp. 12 AP-2014]